MGLMSLLAGGEIDETTLENLRSIDPAEVRKVLSTHLRDAEIDGLLERIRLLLEERDRR